MLDLYCERTGPGLWAEPFNVTSNLAFVAAAVAVARLRARPHASASMASLFGRLTMAIGLGSACFHMMATPWARLFDEGPIVIFQIAFLWLYLRRVATWRAWPAIGLIVLVMIASLAARAILPGALNGSLPYIPALLATAGLGLNHAIAGRRERLVLLAGSALFAVAVWARTMDNLMCASYARGTHFVWHLLAAGVLYLFARGLVFTVREP